MDDIYYMPNADAFHAFTRYQRGRSLSPKTIARRRVSLRAFAGFIAPLALFDANVTLIDDWLSTLSAPATRRAYRSDLMSFYTWGSKRDLCVNPVLRTDAVKVPKSLPRPVPASMLPTVLASAVPDVRLMVALGAYAGLRCAEIAALQRSDIDLLSESPTLAVRCGKGGKDRIVPIHPQLAQMLRGIPPGPVVKVCARSVGAKVTAHLRSLGIDATAHKLRSTFGSELARATSGNVVLVATLMGHDDISTTMRYIGWSGGAGSDAVNSMYPAA